MAGSADPIVLGSDDRPVDEPTLSGGLKGDWSPDAEGDEAGRKIPFIGEPHLPGVRFRGPPELAHLLGSAVDQDMQPVFPGGISRIRDVGAERLIGAFVPHEGAAIPIDDAGVVDPAKAEAEAVPLWERADGEVATVDPVAVSGPFTGQAVSLPERIGQESCRQRIVLYGAGDPCRDPGCDRAQILASPDERLCKEAFVLPCGTDLPTVGELLHVDAHD